jgi:hypothetical protein
VRGTWLDVTARPPGVWHKTVICTWNIGKGTVRDLRRLLREQNPDVIHMQEMGGVHGRRFLRVLRRAGYAIVCPDLPGAPSTPSAFKRSRFDVGHEIVRLVVHAGDGPDIHKDKYLIGARVWDKVAHRSEAYVGLHCPFHQSKPGNHAAAEKLIDAAFAWGELRAVPAFISGDFNRKPEQVGHPEDWWCNHTIGVERATHGAHWSPDQVWGNERPDVRYVGSRVVTGTKSDHTPLVVTVEIKEHAAR